MNTFQEYQAIAAKVPIALRNNRDRIELPIRGLQGEAGKIGSLLAIAFGPSKFNLTPEQTSQIKERLSEILWCVALLCDETKIAMQDVAEHGIAQLQARARELDPDRR